MARNKTKYSSSKVHGVVFSIFSCYSHFV